ncbi:MAG: SET domain-containing protein [Caldilineaceae bacterium]|nr:SET domain-containing protein [Caldilineaceae bacterium]
MNLASLHCSRKSSKLEGHIRGDGERGLFARESIHQGELLAVFGGKIVTYEELIEVPYEIRRLSIQVAEDFYLLSVEESQADWINHSCTPTAGLNGQIMLVAMRNIGPGEEITFDYAMSDGTPYDEFDCMCGSLDCRGYVSGNDWKLPELQRRYRGYFSPYLQARINRMQDSDT